MLKIPTFLSLITLSSLNLHCHLHPLQAANCCRNSRLVVDEDDLKWVKNEKKITSLLKQSHENFRYKTLSCWKLSHFSDMQNDVFMNREGSKGLIVNFNALELFVML